MAYSTVLGHQFGRRSSSPATASFRNSISFVNSTDLVDSHPVFVFLRSNVYNDSSARLPLALSILLFCLHFCCSHIGWPLCLRRFFSSIEHASLIDAVPLLSHPTL